LPRTARRGRPRIRCESCAADKRAVKKAWIAANREKIDAYNELRRRLYAEERAASLN
jgi:hypothetical protein